MLLIINIFYFSIFVCLKHDIFAEFVKKVEQFISKNKKHVLGTELVRIVGKKKKET